MNTDRVVAAIAAITVAHYCASARWASNAAMIACVSIDLLV
jgi:hypothetical protein